MPLERSPHHAAALRAFTDAIVNADNDWQSATRTQVADFANQVHKTVAFCTAHNIQQCSYFIFSYVMPAAGGIATLGQYMAFLSKESERDTLHPSKASGNSSPRSMKLNGLRPAYMRLHILYVVHDVLMAASEYARYTQSAQPAYPNTATATGHLITEAIRLLHFAACHGSRSTAVAVQPLKRLLDAWKHKGFVSTEDAEMLEGAIDSHESRDLANVDELYQAWEHAQQAKATEKARLAVVEAASWRLPKSHGAQDDPEVAWTHLPAANGLFMRWKRGFPMRHMAFEKGGCPLKHADEMADDTTKTGVKDLVNDALRPYGKFTDPDEVMEVDAIGTIIWDDTGTRNAWNRTGRGVRVQKRRDMRYKASSTGYDGIAETPKTSAMLGDAAQRAKILAEQIRQRKMNDGDGAQYRDNFDDRQSWGQGRGGFGDNRDFDGGNDYRGEQRNFDSIYGGEQRNFEGSYQGGRGGFDGGGFRGGRGGFDRGYGGGRGGGRGGRGSRRPY